MAKKIVRRRLLHFQQIIQSWIGNEDKDVDLESIEKQLKFNCPICMDEIKLKTSTL